jgi:hypothetical protein
VQQVQILQDPKAAA